MDMPTDPSRLPNSEPAADWDDERNSFRKYGVRVLAGLLAVGGIGWAWNTLTQREQGSVAPPPPQTIKVSIQKVVPLPESTPPPKEKKIFVRAEAPPPPRDPGPPEGPTTQTPGNKPGGVPGRTGGEKPGTERRLPPSISSELLGWQRYASRAQGPIARALQANPKTRKAKFSHVDVRLWPDVTGRITKATLVNSTGDSALDLAIRDEVLTGMLMPLPPPVDMPTPMVLRLRAASLN